MLPHTSVTVQVRVTTIGHTPVATSIYETDTIPQLSLVFPEFGGLSKTASVELAEVAEKGGDVITLVVHPVKFRVTAHVVIVGGTSAVTVKVETHVVTVGAQALVYVKVTVRVPPQADGGPGLLFVSTPLHPPPALTEANQVLYFVSMADWV